MIHTNPFYFVSFIPYLLFTDHCVGNESLIYLSMETAQFKEHVGLDVALLAHGEQLRLSDFYLRVLRVQTTKHKLIFHFDNARDLLLYTSFVARMYKHIMNIREF